MKAYQTKSGLTQYKASIAAIREAEQDGETLGWCLACGESQSGCEPDARKYECESCGKPKVYGGEELALMGLTY